MAKTEKINSYKKGDQELLTQKTPIKTKLRDNTMTKMMTQK
jgi:hypothetical protein